MRLLALALIAVGVVLIVVGYRGKQEQFLAAIK